MRKLIFLLVLISAATVILPKFFPDDLGEQLSALRLENENLKAQLLRQKFSPVSSEKYLVAKVYSVYPFNNQSELIVAAGELSGVKFGMPVTIGENILVGQVYEVGEKSSVVKTVWDSDWQISVRIGDSAVDALLIGGRTPTLSLIDKKAEVKEGDPVYSASRGFPYGLTLGNLGTLESGRGDPFQTASLILPYSRDLKEVWILKTY